MSLQPQARADAFYFLKRSPLFGGLGEENLHRLTAVLKALALSKGTVLCHQGEHCDGFYLIRSGRIRVMETGPEGEEQVLAYLGRGDTLGELALLTGEVHTTSVVLDTACELLVLSKREFDKLLEENPLIGAQLSRLLSRRLAVSYHAREAAPSLRPSELIGICAALPPEETTLLAVALSIAFVEQTRRRVLLWDLTETSGEIARALGLHPVKTTESMLHEGDLRDVSILQRITTTHLCGLEILSIPSQTFAGRLFPSLPTFLSMLRDRYDYSLVLLPAEKDPVARAILSESARALFFASETWPSFARRIWADFQQNHASSPAMVQKVWLYQAQPKPNWTSFNAPAEGPSDFRIPWPATIADRFHASRSPFLDTSIAGKTFRGIERIARYIGKLRVGLAMGSGAAYGYTLIGILQVFERENIPVDVLAGTSMGALIGSFFCAGKTPTHLEEIARSITKRWLLEHMLGDVTFPLSGFLAGQTILGFLRDILGETDFQDLEIPFAAVATDIRSGHEVVLTEGRVAQAIRASISLPILFVPTLLKGRYLVDGGLVNPVPASVVAHMGADILISVNLTAKPSVRRGFGQRRRPFPLTPRTPKMLEVFFKMLYTMQYEIAQARTEIAHVVLAPDTRPYLWTDFYRAPELIKIGADTAEEALPKIKALLPFFSDYCKVSIAQPLRVY